MAVLASVGEGESSGVRESVGRPVDHLGDQRKGLECPWTEPPGEEVSERAGAERIYVTRGQSKKLRIRPAPNTLHCNVPNVRIINGIPGEVRSVGGSALHVGLRSEDLKP